MPGDPSARSTASSRTRIHGFSYTTRDAVVVHGLGSAAGALNVVSTPPPCHTGRQDCSMARPRSWTDTDLRNAIAAATSWRDTARALALTPTGHTHRLLRQRAWALGLSTAHFDSRPSHRETAEPVSEGTKEQRRATSRNAARQWDDSELARAVREANSWAGVHHELGLVIGGTTYRMLKERAAHLGLDTTHFTGQGWRRGATTPPPGVGIPLQEILVEHSTYDRTDALRRRLLREGLKEARCEGCGLREWNGAPAHSSSITSTASAATTAWRTCVSCARTAMRRPRHGAARTRVVYAKQHNGYAPVAQLAEADVSNTS